jgi:two-component system NarL family sensor kinase
VVLGLALAWMNRLPLERLVAEYVLAQALATIAFATVGLIIAARRPEHTIGWLFCAAGIGYGQTTWIGQYTRYTLVTQPGALPAGELIAWLFFWSWIPIVMLVVVGLPLLFPDGRLPSPRWRPALWLAVIATALNSLSLAISPGPMDASLPEVANPFAPAWASQVQPIIERIAVVLVLASMISGVAAQIVRFRRARLEERQQIKWFAYAIILLLLALVVPATLAFPDFTQDTLLSGSLLALAYPLLAAAVGVAVLRYRLYNIDLLISRTLVYSALTVCIITIYVLVVGYLGALVQGGDTLLVSLIATGLVAILFQPLSARLQRGVNRLLYGYRNEPYIVLARLGQRLRDAIEPNQVLPSLAATVRDALRLPYVAVALRRDDALVVVASDGVAAGEPLRLPLAYQGEAVGELLVCPRVPGEAWAPADLRLLEDLAHQAGVAAHSVRLMAELQRAREWLVLAREEERRRLRRDLHDDLAPSLAALGLTAATVGELIPKNPEAAAQVAAKLHTAIRTVVGDVRRLVYDLRPPTLDELGLVEAIREHAARICAQPPASGAERARLQVLLDVPEQLPPLPAAVEVAAFRLAQEALTNVLRHAQARRCTIRLAYIEGRALALEIVDDGIGLPAQRQAGVGLHTMRERAAELGGVCAIERIGKSGTRVSAWWPIVEVEKERL